MLKDRIEDSLTFDDVLLLPGYSKVLPSEVSVKSRITQTLECNIQLISVAMDTVTEHQTAIYMAQEGGIGIIHKNMTADDQATQVKMVNGYRTPDSNLHGSGRWNWNYSQKHDCR